MNAELEISLAVPRSEKSSSISGGQFAAILLASSRAEMMLSDDVSFMLVCVYDPAVVLEIMLVITELRYRFAWHYIAASSFFSS